MASRRLRFMFFVNVFIELISCMSKSNCKAGNKAYKTATDKN